MKIPVGVSNRHVHLTEEAYLYLFDNKKIEKRNDLNQVGEFASTDTIDLEYEGKLIEHIRILGPFRNQNQIELLESDLKYLNLDAPIRRSGNLNNTPSVILKNGNKSLKSTGVIRAERHVHMPEMLAQKLNFHDRDIVKITSPKCSFEARIKVSPNAFLELHIDKDEAAAYELNNRDEVEMEKM